MKNNKIKIKMREQKKKGKKNINNNILTITFIKPLKV
jgi:hypothetical protein